MPPGRALSEGGSRGRGRRRPRASEGAARLKWPLRRRHALYRARGVCGDGERAKLPGGAAASSRRRLEGGQHVCGLKKERGQKKGDKADRKAEYKPCGEMYARQGEMPFISRLVTVLL